MSDSLDRIPGGFLPDGDLPPDATAPARTSSAGASWLDQLQPASWRGVPFVVRGSEYRRGRRPAVHEYPFRDLPWVEDVGRASRLVGFSGFVVGDDCYAQAQRMLQACEQPGPGNLVHPSLGSLTVSLIEPAVASERTELGRVVEFRFEFMETGTVQFPAADTSTQDVVASKANDAQAASASDFASAVGTDNNGASTVTLGATAAPGPTTTYTDSKGSVTLVPSVVGGSPYQATSGGETVRLWGDNAVTQASDSSLTANAVAAQTPPLGTTYGRYSGVGPLSFGSADTETALSDQTANRDAVSSAAADAAIKAGA